MLLQRLKLSISTKIIGLFLIYALKPEVVSEDYNLEVQMGFQELRPLTKVLTVIAALILMIGLTVWLFGNSSASPLKVDGPALAQRRCPGTVPVNPNAVIRERPGNDSGAIAQVFKNYSASSSRCEGNYSLVDLPIQGWLRSK